MDLILINIDFKYSIIPKSYGGIEGNEQNNMRRAMYFNSFNDEGIYFLISKMKDKKHPPQVELFYNDYENYLTKDSYLHMDSILMGKNILGEIKSKIIINSTTKNDIKKALKDVFGLEDLNLPFELQSSLNSYINEEEEYRDPILRRAIYQKENETFVILSHDFKCWKDKQKFICAYYNPNDYTVYRVISFKRRHIKDQNWIHCGYEKESKIKESLIPNIEIIINFKFQN